MSWTCPRCHEELGDLNGECQYCKESDGVIVYNPDKYYVREIRIRHLSDGSKPVTPQEELFQKLFNGEVKIVSGMEILERRARREELSDIAFRARIGVQAIDHVEKEERKTKSQSEKPQGFERSLNIDEASTEAINAIRGRQEKLTKKEKILAGLKKLYETAGIDKSFAEKQISEATSNVKILGVVRKDKDGNVIPEKFQAPVEEKKEVKPFVNPFEKPTTPENKQ